MLEALAEDEAVESVTSYFDSGLVSMVSEDGSQAVVFIALKGDDTREEPRRCRDCARRWRARP